MIETDRHLVDVGSEATQTPVEHTDSKNFKNTIRKASSVTISDEPKWRSKKPSSVPKYLEYGKSSGRNPHAPQPANPPPSVTSGHEQRQDHPYLNKRKSCGLEYSAGEREVLKRSRKKLCSRSDEEILALCGLLSPP
ncbi:hypothetical protein AAMO2058_000322200 [Amorphochlora amoebiformis]